MRILVTGAGGMLGHALCPVLAGRHEVVGLLRSDCDLRDEAAVRRVFEPLKPDLVMHLAAFTNVDACEREPERARAENAEATRHVARAAKKVDAVVLYLSTDYVFNGESRRPYVETDSPDPLNVYGRTKLLGESYLQQILRRFFIVRTSWLFGQHGKNFVATILRLAKEKNELRVVDDQLGSPTYTRHLAEKLGALVTTAAYGIYHMSGAGTCTWYEFARRIFEFSGHKNLKVKAVSSAEYVCDARRPAYSVLSNQRALDLGIGLLPHWEQGLKDYLQELREEPHDVTTGSLSGCASCV